MSEKRNSNIELLRIIAMILIILHHYAVVGMSNADILLTNHINSYMIDIASLGGKVGTVIFVLIGSYYMSDGNMNGKKIYSILIEVWFYSILLGGFYFILSQGITIKNIFAMVFPVISYQYWFVTCYILLMFVSPFLNSGINNLSKDLLKYIIIVGILIWVILPTIGIELIFNSYIYFVLLYLIAAYTRKYIDLSNYKKHFVFGITYYMMIIFSAIGLRCVWGGGVAMHY